jgi:hypothetical protein
MAEELLASQDRLCCVVLFNCSVQVYDSLLAVVQVWTMHRSARI